MDLQKKTLLNIPYILSPNPVKIYLTHTSDGNFSLSTWEDWLNLKNFLKESIGSLPKNLGSSTTSQPATTLPQSCHASDLQDGLLVTEISGKKLKIELEYLPTQAYIKHPKDLNLLFWWLENTKAAILDQIERTKLVYVIEYQTPCPGSQNFLTKERFVGLRQNNLKAGFGITYRSNGMISHIGEYL